jgi:hypothetical protein
MIENPKFGPNMIMFYNLSADSLLTPFSGGGRRASIDALAGDAATTS